MPKKSGGETDAERKRRGAKDDKRRDTEQADKLIGKNGDSPSWLPDDELLK